MDINQTASPEIESPATAETNPTQSERLGTDSGWDFFEGQRKLAPHGLYFGIADLDEIAAGENWDEHQATLADGTYLDGVLQYIEWWIAVADSLAENRDSTDPRLVAFRKTVPLMVNEVLSCYSAALAWTPPYSGSHRDLEKIEGLELLKRYRQFTVYVRDFARVVWRDYRIDWLWGQA